MRRSRRNRRITRVGWSVIAVGILSLFIGGLVVWQDDLSVEIAQDRLNDRLSQRLALVAAGVSPSALAGTVTDAGLEVDTEPPVVLTGEGEDDPRIAAPPVPVTTLPSDEPVDASLPQILREMAPPLGEPIGRIEIPDIDLDWVIIEGVEPGDLNRGPGHMPWTAVPGQPGNAVISGHRTTHGAPFFDLDLLEAGDPIRVTTLIGTHFYEVVGIRVVSPEGVWVTQPRDGSWLTLTTCNPKGSSRERLIVFARLVDGPNIDGVEARYPEADYSLPLAPEEAQAVEESSLTAGDQTG